MRHGLLIRNPTILSCKDQNKSDTLLTVERESMTITRYILRALFSKTGSSYVWSEQHLNRKRRRHNSQKQNIN